VTVRATTIARAMAWCVICNMNLWVPCLFNCSKENQTAQQRVVSLPGFELIFLWQTTKSANIHLGTKLATSQKCCFIDIVNAHGTNYRCWPLNSSNLITYTLWHRHVDMYIFGVRKIILASESLCTSKGVNSWAYSDKPPSLFIYLK
jgi:hypothetical protein